MSYLETTKDVYKKAAENPDVGLCCTTTPIWQLPELEIPNGYGKGKERYFELVERLIQEVPKAIDRLLR